MYTEHVCVFLELCLFRSPQMSPSKTYMTGLPTTPWWMGQSSPPAPCPAHKPGPKCPRPTLLSTPFLASGLTLSRTWWSPKQTSCHSPLTGLGGDNEDHDHDNYHYNAGDDDHHDDDQDEDEDDDNDDNGDDDNDNEDEDDNNDGDEDDDNDDDVDVHSDIDDVDGDYCDDDVYDVNYDDDDEGLFTNYAIYFRGVWTPPPALP